jgi:hypothetical protein
MLVLVTVNSIASKNMWETDFRVSEGVEEGNARRVGYKAQPTKGRTAASSIVRHGKLVNVRDFSVGDAV